MVRWLGDPGRAARATCAAGCWRRWMAAICAKATARLFQVGRVLHRRGVGPARRHWRDRGPGAAQPADARAAGPSRGHHGRGGAAAGRDAGRAAGPAAGDPSGRGRPRPDAPDAGPARADARKEVGAGGGAGPARRRPAAGRLAGRQAAPSPARPIFVDQTGATPDMARHGACPGPDPGPRPARRAWVARCPTGRARPPGRARGQALRGRPHHARLRRSLRPRRCHRRHHLPGLDRADAGARAAASRHRHPSAPLPHASSARIG